MAVISNSIIPDNVAIRQRKYLGALKDGADRKDMAKNDLKDGTSVSIAFPEGGPQEEFPAGFLTAELIREAYARNTPRASPTSLKSRELAERGKALGTIQPRVLLPAYRDPLCNQR